MPRDPDISVSSASLALPGSSGASRTYDPPSVPVPARAYPPWADVPKRPAANAGKTMDVRNVWLYEFREGKLIRVTRTLRS